LPAESPKATSVPEFSKQLSTFAMTRALKVHGRGHPSQELDVDESLVQILKQIISDIQQLLRAEFALAHSELSTKISRAVTAALPILIGVVLALAGLPILLMTLVVLLAIWLPIWLSLLLVTAIVLIGSGVAITVGLRRLAETRPVPERTVSNLRKDAEVIKEDV
jgi:uncharacterized membrane protein YqjE